MPVCAVTTCWNSSVVDCFTRNGITYHKFPKDPELRTKWMTAIRRKRMIPNKYSFVCSTHFESSCYELEDGIRRLRPDAMPTLFLPLPAAFFKNKLNKSATATVVSDTELPGPSNASNTAVNDSTMICKDTLNLIEDSDSDESESLLIKPKKKVDVHEIMNVLRKNGFIDQQQEDTLRNIGLENRHIAAAKHQSKRLGVGWRMRPEFSSRLKVFALKLITYSPEGYEYIREHYSTRLPPTRIVNRWFTFDEKCPTCSTASTCPPCDKELGYLPSLNNK